MDLFLKSLRDSQKLSMPDLPVVTDYASKWGAAPHDIRLFPAVIRSSELVKPESILEHGQATCFFHERVPATAICDVSGRMICNLCTTEYKGKTVSLEALQTLVGNTSDSKVKNYQTKWDSIALALAVFPLLTVFFTLFTAPIVLWICIFKWKEGPTGVFSHMRWRYVVAGLLSLAQIAFWVLSFTGKLGGVLA
jgi:hypothetical protein